jgi:hypothetical protein
MNYIAQLVQHLLRTNSERRAVNLVQWGGAKEEITYCPKIAALTYVHSHVSGCESISSLRFPVARNEKEVSRELEQVLADEPQVAKSWSRCDQTSHRGVEEEVIEVALVIVSQGRAWGAIECAVEDVVRVDFQAEGNPFGELRILENAEVSVVERIAAEYIACGAGVGIPKHICRKLIVRNESNLRRADDSSSLEILQHRSAIDGRGCGCWLNQGRICIDTEGADRSFWVGEDGALDVETKVVLLERYVAVGLIRTNVPDVGCYTRAIHYRVVGCRRTDVHGLVIGIRLAAVVDPDRICLPTIH